MTLDNLVGRLAIRYEETSLGGALFIYEPTLILSCEEKIATVCMLSENDFFDIGAVVTLTPDYMDGKWSEYGEVFDKSCETKSQVVALLLRVLGISANEDVILNLCRVVSLRQLLQGISDECSVTDLLSILNDKKSSSEDESWDVPADSVEASGWKQAISPNLKPSFNGFVKRGVPR